MFDVTVRAYNPNDDHIAYSRRGKAIRSGWLVIWRCHMCKIEIKEGFDHEPTTDEIVALGSDPYCSSCRHGVIDVVARREA